MKNLFKLLVALFVLSSCGRKSELYTVYFTDGSVAKFRMKEPRLSNSCIFQDVDSEPHVCGVRSFKSSSK